MSTNSNTKMSKKAMLAAINQQHGTMIELGLDGENAVISLVKIAEITGRRHTHLMERVRSFIEGEEAEGQPKNWSADFLYEPTTYRDAQGKERPTYNLNREAFYDFTLSMNGEKEDAIRKTYIRAFKALEQMALDEAHHEVADLRLKLAQKADKEHIKKIAKEMVWRGVIPASYARSKAYNWLRDNCEDFESYFKTKTAFNDALAIAGWVYKGEGQSRNALYCGDSALNDGYVKEPSPTLGGHKGMPHITAYGLIYIQNRAKQLHSLYIKYSQ